MVEHAVDHLEEAHVQIGQEAGFGLGQVLKEEEHTGLGWVVFGTFDHGTVEET